MQVYDAKNIKYKDGLAEKRRRVWVLKTLFFVGLVIAIVGFVLYLLFFSGFLEIKELSVSGLDKVNSNKFHDELNKRLNSKWLGFIEYQRNVLFFSSEDFKAEIFAVFPEIKEISVSKEPPHALNFNVIERATAGIWCFVDDCKYFDKEGVLWGEAAKSSGFLILSVDDLRQDSGNIDQALLEIIILISGKLAEINIFVSKFMIPSDFIGDFSTFTSSGYELLFSTDSDISKQLEVLEIFLAEKKDNFDFKLQYIDLRINGRVYYK
ncbi:MAG: hypothetical protein HY505_01415 [Candidatus Yanofskybacteria bacterium]|nr:hypothetical protein [Candidatus Yanofskybacteria bacterium]